VAEIKKEVKNIVDEKGYSHVTFIGGQFIGSEALIWY